MDVLIFGATGMVGHSVLRECRIAADVCRVVAVGRTPANTQHARFTNLVAPREGQVDVGARQGSNGKRAGNPRLQGHLCVRPGVIQPLHSVRSKALACRAAYVFAKPLFGLIRTFWPRSIVSPVDVGQAMLTFARSGCPRLALASTPLLLAGDSILVAVHLHTGAVGEEVLCFGT
jgi:hypothetical protein